MCQAQHLAVGAVPSHPAVDLLTDSGQSSLLPLHIQQLHQRLDGHPLGAGQNQTQQVYQHALHEATQTLSSEFTLFPHLYKDGEEDDHNSCCDEESFLWEVVNQEDEGETDCPSQASVGNDELVSKGHSISPELVHHSSQQENTFRRGEMC